MCVIGGVVFRGCGDQMPTALGIDIYMKSIVDVKIKDDTPNATTVISVGLCIVYVLSFIQFYIFSSLLL